MKIKSPEEQEIDKILTECHRNKQIEHGVIDENGNKLPRIRRKPPDARWGRLK